MLSIYRWRFFLLSLLLTSPIYSLYFLPLIFRKSIELHFLPLYGPFQLEFLYNSLIIFYVFPSIFFNIFKEKILGVFTFRRFFFIANFLLFCGEILFQAGFSRKSMFLLIFSRFLYGFGAESLFFIINVLLLKYFSKEFVGFLNAFLSLFCNIVACFSFVFYGYLFFYYDISLLLFINKVLIFSMFFIAIFTVFYDFYLEKNTEKICVFLEN